MRIKLVRALRALELTNERTVISVSSMATSSILVFPSTPRLKPVALPDDLIEDQAYIANAMRSTDTLASEGKSLGLLGVIASSAGPFMKEVKRLSSRLQALAIEKSLAKIHSGVESGSRLPTALSPLSTMFNMFPNGGTR